MNLHDRLEVLAGTTDLINRAILDIVLAPFFDGRIPEGDTRSADLKSAIADLLAAADRVGAQALADLEQLQLREGNR